MSADARDTLRRLATVDRCVAVWCAAQCARAVLHLVPAGEDRPRLAVEAAEAWAQEPTAENRGAAGSNRPAALSVSFECSNVAYYAAVAAWRAVRSVTFASDTPFAAIYAATAISKATYVGTSISRELSKLDTAILAARWSLTVPTRDEVLAADEPTQVAWDRVAHIEGELSVEQLLEAHTRAQSLGLPWEDVSRAVVERLVVGGDGEVAAVWRAA